MLVITLTVALLCSVTVHSEYECTHDKLEFLPPVIAHQQINMNELKRDISQTRFTQPLKILFNFDNLVGDLQTCYQAGVVVQLSDGPYTCTSDDVLTNDKTNYLQQLVVNGSLIWTETLAVIPVVSLDVSAGCPMYAAGIQPPPPQYSSITDANYVLYVTARPFSSNNVVAVAITCLLDQYNRPIAGYANFNPAKLLVGNALLNQQQISIASHELAHALGFSSSGMSNFVSWPVGATVPNLISKSSFIVTDSTTNISYVTSPRVLSEARNHFNCTNTLVAPLESLGGPVTAGSHWGMKQFYNEIMVGSVSSFPMYSQITFAYFEDSGWYGINNRSNIQTLVWGRQRGCNFIYNCSNWPLSTEDDPGYKCTSNTFSIEQCTFDLHSQGQCNDQKAVFNPLIDTCRYIYAPDVSRCDNPSNINSIHNNVGEFVGPNSRCFPSNILQLTQQFTLPSPPGIPLTQCYNTTCQSKTDLKVGVNGIWYDCPYEGGDVYPIGYGGSIRCIPNAADRVCLDAVNDTDWPVITGVFPTVAAPNSIITIYGLNFLATNYITASFVKGISTPCSSLIVENDTALNCTLPDDSAFATLADVAQSLSGFVPVSILVTDEFGRTDLLVDGLEISVTAEETIDSFFHTYPYWIAIIAVIAFLLVVGIIVAVCKFSGCNPLESINYRSMQTL